MRNFTIFDYSELSAARDHAGRYGFWATYRWVAQEDNRAAHYEREYHATHEFGLCRNCGRYCESPKEYEVHDNECTSEVTAEEALHDLLAAVSRQGEKAAYFDGPAFRITVSK